MNLGTGSGTDWDMDFAKLCTNEVFYMFTFAKQKNVILRCSYAENENELCKISKGSVNSEQLVSS